MRNRFIIGTAIVDLVLLSISLAFGSLVVFGVTLPWQAQGLGVVVVPMVSYLIGSAVVASLLTIGMAPGLPRPTIGRGLAIVLSTGLLTSVAILSTRVYFSRSLLLVTFAAWAVLTIGHRVVRHLRPWTEPMVLVTDEKELVAHLENAKHALIVESIDPQSEGELDLPPAGTTIALDLRSLLSQRVATFVSSCDLAGYSVRPLASVYEEHTGRVPLLHVAEGWEIAIPLNRTTPYLLGKRVFDVVAVLATSPLWIALAAMIGAYTAVTSGRPVLFRQERVGHNGHTFTMVKFRTMTTDAEKDGPRFAERDDPRLNPGGRFLRRSRLDEIPQLWNVLVGDMSLVGPRAEQVPFAFEFERQIPFYNLRHMVRPGLTGWAQVYYRYADDNADTIEKLTYDLYYIKRMTPLLDLEILWRSVWTVLSGAGSR